MGTLTYPYSLQAGTPENVNHLNSNLTAIANVLNGNVDTTNLSASAGITAAQLAAGAKMIQSATVTGGTSVGTGALVTTGATLTWTPSANEIVLVSWTTTIVVASGATINSQLDIHNNGVEVPSGSANVILAAAVGEQFPATGLAFTTSTSGVAITVDLRHTSVSSNSLASPRITVMRFPV